LIIVALITGAIFGAIFKSNPNNLNLLNNYNNEIYEFYLVNDNFIKVINPKVGDTLQFNRNEAKKLISYFKQNIEDDLKIIVKEDGLLKSLDNIKNIESQPTIATIIKPFGDLFIRLLSFIAIPLVLSTLIIGAGSLDDVKKLGRIGIKTFSLFMITTIIAISIGMSLANIIKPGNQISNETKSTMVQEYQSSQTDKLNEEPSFDLIDFFVNIVPKNPFESIMKGDMLQIVFFAVMIGLALTFVKPEHSKPILDFFTGFSEVMLKIVHLVMYLAPIGVFALIASTVANFGFEIISTLIWYILTVLLGLTLQIFLVYGLLIKLFAKMKFSKFMNGLKEAQIIAFSTSSSAATLPVTLDCVEKNLKVPSKIAGFVLPLGATINMDGTALYQGVAAIFISQIYGMDLSLSAQLSIVITAVLASIGTAPVPGVGIIMLVMILNSVNIPAEGIAIILGVDRLLDMARTISNISGDAAISVVVAASEK